MQLSVSTSVPITFEKIEDISDGRFTKVKIYLMHTGKNLNNSYFDKQVVEDAIPSLANIPILGFIEVDNKNQADFKGHEQRLIIDEDGVSIEYLGRSYGVIPENNNARFETLVGDDGVEREYLVVDGILWNKFQEAIEIFDRDEKKSQSMELYGDSIKGEFKNGVFHFSDFKFEGACILGNSVRPAMVNSIIEKVDFSTALNTSFSEMISEFNEIYSKIDRPSSADLNNNTKKGGNGVFDELFAQYPTLSEEDVAEIKENLDQFDADSLKAKLDEILAEKEKSQEPEDQFSTAQQLKAEIIATLSKQTFTNDWGGQSRAYWYIDHDDNRVYAEDAENGYLPVGMNYTKNGDFIEIDFESKKRVKFVPQDMEGDGESSLSVVSQERNEFEVAKAKEDTEQEVSEKFANLQSEFDELKPQFEKLEEKNKELQTKVDEFSKQDLSKENEKLKEQIDELIAYKRGREKQDKLDIVEKFNQLTDEDKQPVLDELDSLTVEEVEEKMFALIGRKGIKSFNRQSGDHLVTGISDFGASSNSGEPDWVAWVKEYKSKK